MTVTALLRACVVLIAVAPAASGAKLHPETVRAWDRYVERTEERIRSELDAPARALLTRECREIVLGRGFCVLPRETREPDGTAVSVPKGRIHHWLGSVLVPGATLDEVLDFATDYENHERFFEDVEASDLLARDGDRFEISLRLKRTRVVTVHYETEHVVSYRRVAPDRAFSRSRSTRIAQIVDPGMPGERTLPPGDDSGFLWRLSSYWRFVAIEEGVVVECESLSLSRDIPAAVRWLVAPFVRSVPRESLEATLAGIRRGSSLRAQDADGIETGRGRWGRGSSRGTRRERKGSRRAKFRDPQSAPRALSRDGPSARAHRESQGPIGCQLCRQRAYE